MDRDLSGVARSAAAGKPRITRYFQQPFNPALTSFVVVFIHSIVQALSLLVV